MARNEIYDKLLTEASDKYSYLQAAKDARALAKDRAGLARREVSNLYNEYNNRISKAPLSVQRTMRMILDKYKAIIDAALDKSVSDSSVNTALERFRKNVENKIGKKLDALDKKLADAAAKK